MTKEDWKNIEEKLSSFYNIVKLKCDEYEVSLRLERVSNYKNGISVYVNGQIKGEWFNGETEEARRFFQKITRSLYSSKKTKPLTKRDKKILSKSGIDLDKKYHYYSPYWKSFGSLKKSFIKQNKVIELLETSY